jgi:hypothetical protein
MKGKRGMWLIFKQIAVLVESPLPGWFSGEHRPQRAIG